MFGSAVQLVHAGQHAATIRHIAVTGDDRDLGVEITASRPVIARTQTVTDPDRLIIDLPEARPDAGLQKVAIHRGKLKDVRVGLLSANPPITRVVMDLAAPTQYRVSPLANTIVVTLGSESANVPGAIVPTNNPPAVRPSETTSALPMPPPEEPAQRSWAHWIMPVLVTTSVVAMLVISLLVHIQNRRNRRGI
jgi:hypothetical protein